METITLIDGTLLEYQLIRKNVKNINLTVRPDLSVFVSANNDVPMEAIEDFILKKTRWITNRIGKFSRTLSENNIEKEYVNGESVKHLGKQYRLKIKESVNESVYIEDSYIIITLKNINKKTTKKRLLDEWIRNQAANKFEDSLDRMFKEVIHLKIEKPQLEFKIMTRRWGSYIRKTNKVILNLELIKAPVYSIDYVVLHELLHFKYKYHNEDFFEALTVIMPDWKDRKKLLDEDIVLHI